MAEALHEVKLTSSVQDYLEMIFSLLHSKGAARVRDIARGLGVRQSAVSNALHTLSDRGLVNYAPYELVTLTDAGKHAAEEIAQKHELLREFFVDVLGLDEKIADENACRIEHHIDPAVLRRLDYLREYTTNSRSKQFGQWLKNFMRYCQRREKQTPQNFSKGKLDGKPNGKKEASK